LINNFIKKLIAGFSNTQFTNARNDIYGKAKGKTKENVISHLAPGPVTRGSRMSPQNSSEHDDEKIHRVTDRNRTLYVQFGAS
jgi:hypothetical protein